MRFNCFFILILALLFQAHLFCMDELRPTPFPLHAPEDDAKESEKVINKIRFNIYQRDECKKALKLAFMKMRENQTIPNLTWIEEQQHNALLLVKEMWRLYIDTDIPESVLPLISDNGSSSLENIQHLNAESARDLVQASMNLVSEEKSKTIYNLRTQRILLCSTAGILTVIGILTNFITYYGICHKN